jgi:hypothetical protein
MLIINCSSTHRVTTLWKCVEIFWRRTEVPRMAKKRKTANPRNGSALNEGMHACSACAGDYEDPDRTAWAADEMDHDAADGERDAARGDVTEEFPAED